MPMTREVDPLSNINNNVYKPPRYCLKYVRETWTGVGR